MSWLQSKKAVLIVAFAGFFLGALWVFALRVALYSHEGVHYHANFGLFVNGKQDDFNNFTFYEEVQACRPENAADPHSRAHMHQPNNHTVHVHDAAVTWGDFFASLGYGLSDKALTTTDGVFVSGQDGKNLHFILNGETETAMAEKVINDKDVLLVSYGNEDATALQTQYKKIPQDAAQVDAGTDPASCGGAEAETFSSRLKHALTP